MNENCPALVMASGAPYLVLDAAGIVDDSHAGGVGSHVQPLDDLSQEDLDLLKL